MEAKEFYELHKGKLVRNVTYDFKGKVVGYVNHNCIIVSSPRFGVDIGNFDGDQATVIDRTLFDSGDSFYASLMKNLELVETSINLVEILKGCEGMEFWCDLSGKCTLEHVDPDEKEYPIDIISLVDGENRWDSLTGEGKFYDSPDGMCLLWPSKTNRDWSTFKKPIKEGTPIMVKLNSEINWYLSVYQKDLNPVYKYVVPVSEFDFNNPDSNKEKSII